MKLQKGRWSASRKVLSLRFGRRHYSESRLYGPIEPAQLQGFGDLLGTLRLLQSARVVNGPSSRARLRWAGGWTIALFCLTQVRELKKSRVPGASSMRIPNRLFLLALLVPAIFT